MEAEIPGFENYIVNSDGFIKTKDRLINSPNGKRMLKGRILKGYTTNKGYKSIVIKTKYKVHHISIHRAVAIAFLENTDNFSEVDHIDGNKSNNNVNNLQWISRLKNMQKAWNDGSIKKLSGEDCSNAKLSYQEVTEIKKLRHSGMKINDIAKKYSMNRSSISSILKGKSWPHHRN